MAADKKSTTPNLDAAWKTAMARGIEAYEARDALAMLQAETEEHLISAKRELVHDAHRLAERLARLADAMESDPGYTVNSLGEVQTSGPAIDLRCAEIGRLREVLRGIESARKAAAEKGGAS
jgi:hypothetical protein